MVFGKACHMPIELEQGAMWALKSRNLNWANVTHARINNLNEIDEFICRLMRALPSIRPIWSIFMIKKNWKENFLPAIGCCYLTQDSVYSQESLKSKLFEPFKVSQVFSNGATDLEGKVEHQFKVNRKRVSNLGLPDKVTMNRVLYLDEPWMWRAIIVPLC